MDRLLRQQSIRAIVADLNTRKVLPPRAALRTATGKPGEVRKRVPAQWHPSTVRKVALRPANAGQIVRDGREFGDAKAPAIVDPSAMTASSRCSPTPPASGSRCVTTPTGRTS